MAAANADVADEDYAVFFVLDWLRCAKPWELESSRVKRATRASCDEPALNRAPLCCMRVRARRVFVCHQFTCPPQV